MKKMTLFLCLCFFALALFAQKKGHIGGENRPYEEPPEAEEKRDTVILMPGMTTYEDLMAVFEPLSKGAPDETLPKMKEREKKLSKLKDGAALLVRYMENPLKKQLRQTMQLQSDLGVTDRLLKDVKLQENAYKEQQGRLAELAKKGDKQSLKEIKQIEKEGLIDSAEVAAKVQTMKDSVATVKASINASDAAYKKMQQTLKKPKELAYIIRSTWAKLYNQLDSIESLRGKEAKTKLLKLTYKDLFAYDDSLQENPDKALIDNLKENLFYNKQGYNIDCAGGVGAGILRTLPPDKAKEAGIDLSLGCKGFMRSLNETFNILFLRLQGGKTFAILWDKNVDTGASKGKVGALKIF